LSASQCDPIKVMSLLSFFQNKDISVGRRRMYFPGASQAQLIGQFDRP
jgi:hypothetical protein